MTVLSTKYDIQQPSTGPYSAIVYIEGTHIVAEDADGKVIVSGVAGTDDDLVRDAALGYISSIGSGLLEIAAGSYIWTTKPTLFDNLVIRGQGENTKIALGANVTPIEISITGSAYEEITVQVSSLYFEVFNGQTNPIILLAANGGGAGALVRRCILRDITINNSHASNRAFNTIELHGIAAGGVLENKFENIILSDSGGCNVGIKLWGTTSGWCNSNEFRNVFIWKPVIGVDISHDTAPSECSGNIFYNTGIEPATWTTDGFKCAASYNKFIGCVLWDWGTAVAPNFQYTIGAAEYYNLIISAAPITTISGLTWSNKIIGAGRESYGSATGTGTDQTIDHYLDGDPFIWITPRQSGTSVTGLYTETTYGYTQSATTPSTDISGGTDNQFYIQADQESTPRLVTLTQAGKKTGTLIAAEMQTKIQALGGIYARITAVYQTGLYYIVSGFNGANSKIRITNAATNNVADNLKIGTTNGGTNTDGVGRIHVTVTSGKTFGWRAAL